MGSDKNVKSYANEKLAGSNRQVPIVVIDGEDYGYWKHPNELLCFLDIRWIKKCGRIGIVIR